MRIKRQAIILPAIFALLLLGPPAAEPHGFYEHKPEPTEGLFKRGEVLYQKQCVVCHGVHGRGDGEATYLLFPKPRNFVEDKFRLVSTANRKATDDDLFEVISRGMAGSSMPSWQHLSEKDRWALVYYVRYLSEVEDYKKQRGGIEETIQAELPWEKIKEIVRQKINPHDIIQIPSEPAVTSEALQRGRELFVTSCAGCHGIEGRGDGQQEMMDSLGRPTRPRNLTAGIFKSDSSSEELYFRMVAGMPGTPMPSYNGSFTQEQIWDLIHFVQSLVPEGKEEKARLKYNTITARRISGEIEMNPLASQWSAIEPLYVALTPLWWRDERIEGVDVKSVHNGEKIAFLLSWADPSKNDNLVEIQSFSDGAALQFSLEEDPPFFGMGSQNDSVHLWHWKAAWENKGENRRDIEHQYPHLAVDYYESHKNYEYGSAFEAAESATRFHDPRELTGWGAGNPVSDPMKETSAEEAVAEGVGTYTTQRPTMEKVDARGIWINGKWHVLFVRSLNPSTSSGSLKKESRAKSRETSDKNDLPFKVGKPARMALAIWDGEAEDRNGQKSVSIWNSLVMEPLSLTEAGGRNKP